MNQRALEDGNDGRGGAFWRWVQGLGLFAFLLIVVAGGQVGSFTPTTLETVG